MLIDEVAWLGHSGFRVAAGARAIYIDPYRVPAGSRKADLILITHGHYDHFSPQDVERLSKPTTEVIAPAAVAERLSGHVRSIAAGEEIFNLAALVVFTSIVVHGLTDTPGAEWLARRAEREDAPEVAA